MLASLQHVRKVRETNPRKDTDTHAHGAFNNEQPSPWVASHTCFGKVLLDPIRDQAAESTGNGGGRVIGGCRLSVAGIDDNAFPTYLQPSRSRSF